MVNKVCYIVETLDGPLILTAETIHLGRDIQSGKQLKHNIQTKIKKGSMVFSFSKS